MSKKKKVCKGVLAGVLLFQTMSCGTLFHPDRRFQSSHGPVDPGIVALNTVGLAFFLVPGVIAFAIDFATGSIFLPPWESTSFSQNDIENGDALKIVFTDKSLMTKENIEKIIGKHSKTEFSFDDKNLKKIKIDSLDDINALAF